MSAKKTRSIWHDPDYYAASFGAFKARYAKDVRETWVETVFPHAVADKISIDQSQNDELKVLGVGSGTGEFDCKLLQQLLKRYPRIFNSVCEPCADHIKKYETLMTEKPLPGVRSEFMQNTIDQMISIHGEKKFDFISSVHSLYYEKDLGQTVLNLVDRLNSGGVMVIIILAGESGLFRLWSKFPDLADDKMNHISSRNIQDALTSNDILFETITQPHHVDITCCFAEEKNADGTLVMDFLAHVINFQETASPEVVEEFVKFVKSPEYSQKTSDGRWLFNNDWDAIIVHKK